MGVEGAAKWDRRFYQSMLVNTNGTRERLWRRRAGREGKRGTGKRGTGKRENIRRRKRGRWCEREGGIVPGRGREREMLAQGSCRVREGGSERSRLFSNIL